MTEKFYGGNKNNNKTVLVNFRYRSLAERGWGGDEDSNIYVPDYRSTSMQIVRDVTERYRSGQYW